MESIEEIYEELAKVFEEQESVKPKIKEIETDQQRIEDRLLKEYDMSKAVFASDMERDIMQREKDSLTEKKEKLIAEREKLKQIFSQKMDIVVEHLEEKIRRKTQELEQNENFYLKNAKDGLARLEHGLNTQTDPEVLKAIHDNLDMYRTSVKNLEERSSKLLKELRDLRALHVLFMDDKLEEIQKKVQEKTKKTAEKSAAKPEGKPEEKTAEKSATKPEGKPAEKSAAKPEGKPEEKTAEKSATKPEGKPAEKSAAKPEGKPEEKSAAKPEAKPAEKSEEKSTAKPEVKPVEKSATKSEGKPVEKSTAKPEAKPVEKSTAKLEAKPAEKSATIPEGKPAEKSATKPEGKPTEKSATKPEEEKTVTKKRYEITINVKEGAITDIKKGSLDLNYSENSIQEAEEIVAEFFKDKKEEDRPKLSYLDPSVIKFFKNYIDKADELIKKATEAKNLKAQEDSKLIKSFYTKKLEDYLDMLTSEDKVDGFKINYDLKGIYDTELSLKEIRRIFKIARKTREIAGEKISIDQDSLSKRFFGNIKKRAAIFTQKASKLLGRGSSEKLIEAGTDGEEGKTEKEENKKRSIFRRKEKTERRSFFRRKSKEENKSTERTTPPETANSDKEAPKTEKESHKAFVERQKEDNNSTKSTKPAETKDPEKEVTFTDEAKELIARADALINDDNDITK